MVTIIVSLFSSIKTGGASRLPDNMYHLGSVSLQLALLFVIVIVTADETSTVDNIPYTMVPSLERDENVGFLSSPSRR